MTPTGTSVTTFEALRGRLFGLAYRMLGSRADAEDVVQETYVRWHQVTPGSVESPEAWLVTTTSRLAIDRLRRLKTEREAYVGPWLPEPIVTEAPPDRDLDLAADLSIAFLTLLERLAPEERAAFLLHDVFDVGYREIAAGDRAERSGMPTGGAPRARARARRPQALRRHGSHEGDLAAAVHGRHGGARRAGTALRSLRLMPPGLRTAAARLAPHRCRSSAPLESRDW